MTIRPDLEPVRTQLIRLGVYAKQADEQNLKDWPHYKNQEDYQNIFKIGGAAQGAWEWVYSHGRDLAAWMSWHLIEHEDVSAYPTLTSYIRSFDNSWVYQVTGLYEGIERARRFIKETPNAPWAVEQMVELFVREVKMLEAIQVVLNELKQSELYLRENGNSPKHIGAHQPGIVVHGSVHQVIGSMQNSEVTNHFECSIPVNDFGALSSKLKDIGVAEEDVTRLKDSLQKDPKPESAEKLGPETSKWMGTMVAKSAAGTWKFGVSVAGGVLAKLISYYYGF